jgi:hypothetical protein
MSPVDNRVLIRLSPSLPPGRLSTLMLMLGFFALKSFASWFAVEIVVSALSTRKVRVTLPPLESPLLEPRLPAPHAESAKAPTATATSAPRRRGELVIIAGPPDRWG